jgi:hypothetical protein
MCSMTAERDFLVWFATKQFMVVKKHRPEVRAHLVKALASVDTHAERCDVKQAQPARVGSAVPEGQTPNTSSSTGE